MSCKIKITADGTPHGTHVFVDGVEIDCTSVSLRHSLHGVPIATIDVYVDEVDVDGEMRLDTIVRVPVGMTTKLENLRTAWEECERRQDATELVHAVREIVDP